MSDLPAPKFQVLDLVRNITTDQTRIVRQINEIDGGGDMLLVRKDEDDEKSILFSWRADSCEPAVPPVALKMGDKVTVGTNPTVGKITDIRKQRTSDLLQYKVERFIGTSNKADWIGAGPHLHLVEAAPVAYDLTATETDAAPVRHNPPTTESTSSESAQVEAPALDDMPLIPSDTAAYDKRIEDLERQLLDARTSVKKLEQIIRNHEAYVTQPQPVALAQRECHEVKVVSLKVGLPETNAEYARMLNEGWHDDSASTVISSSDEVWLTVIFKHTLTTPVQPTIPNGAHATLTGDFVRQSQRTPFRSPNEYTPADEMVIESHQPFQRGPIGTSIQEIGADATLELMDGFALQKAFANAGARLEANPLPDCRPLLGVLVSGK